MDAEARAAIGRRLKESRKAVRLSQSDVADEFNVARQLISAWECGRAMPTCGQWYALAPLYGRSLDYLWYGISTPLSSSLERAFHQAADRVTGSP